MTPKKSNKSRTPAQPTPSTEPSTNDLHQQIADRAYKIYKEGTHQGALYDWLQAEREILQRENQAAA
jgi:hypothetical protein